MSKPVKNVAASVRQQLADLGKKTSRPFAELLQYYGMERFLYRASKSKHRDRFVLKGALMFVVWETPHSRATVDIDFLARTENTVENLVEIVRDICRVESAADGLVFDPDTVMGERIKENADCSGVRVTFTGTLERARIPMQLDIAFGDSVTPGPAEIEYPAMLDSPAPRLKGYPPETVVAEKFEAAVKLGMINTRMKDFYDLWLLSRQFDFDGKTLAAAVRATFAKRGTAVTTAPTAFTPAFHDDAQKQTQWRAFVARTGLSDAPATLKDAIQAAKELLVPVAAACMADEPFSSHWRPPGPWNAK